MLKSWGQWLRASADGRVIVGRISIFCLAVIYFWSLGSGSLRADELAQVNLAYPHVLLHHLVDLPYDALLTVLKHFHLDSNAWLRSVPVVFGLVEACCFYLIVKCWFGRFSAWLGTLFLAATPLYILMSRDASGAIVYLYPLIPIAAYMKWVRSKDHIYERWLALVALAAIATYQPGGIWFLLLSSFYVRSSLNGYVRKLSRQEAILSVCVAIIFLAPLVISLAGRPSLIKPLLLIPAGWPSVLDFIKDLGWSVSALFWHSQAHHQLQIGRLAILNAAQDILLVFGVFAMWARARNKLYMLGGVAALAVVASSLNDNYNLLVITLAPIGLVLTAGLRYLHLEWTSVFPRNPLPRGLAIALLVAVVAIHVLWGAHYALTAWPHSL